MTAELVAIPVLWLQDHGYTLILFRCGHTVGFPSPWRPWMKDDIAWWCTDCCAHPQVTAALVWAD